MHKRKWWRITVRTTQKGYVSGEIKLGESHHREVQAFLDAHDVPQDAVVEILLQEYRKQPGGEH